MSFRDDSDAMRSRIDELERDLARATERIAELEPQAEATLRLQSRVEELERELNVFKETPREKARRADRERHAREAEKKKAKRADVGPDATPPTNSFREWFSRPNAPAKIGLGALGACLAGGLAYWQFAPATWTDAHSPPSMGLIDLSRTPTPPMIHGTAIGTQQTPMGCAGVIPRAPQLVLTTSQPVLAMLDVESPEDTVLVVLDAEGQVHCDDDGGGGHNPYLVVPLPIGESRVWVGTFSVDEHADFSLAVATREGAAMPDARGIAPGAPPSLGVLGEMFEGPRRFEATVLGVTHATSIDQRCPGYIETEPTLALNLTAPTYVDLNAGGDTDLTLFMESNGTIRCDDDGGPGTQPRITELLPIGIHRLWVGTYARVSAPVSYWLEARVAPTDHASEAPRSALALDDELTISPRAEAIVRECAMFIPAAPDAVVELASQLDVSISGPVLVADATGRRCLMPGVTTWTAGRHEVYLSVDTEDTARTATPVRVHATAPSVLPYPH